ncbi:MAG: asparaginase [Streptosporangiales bacterium]
MPAAFESSSPLPVVAEVTRSGFVESWHAGSVVAIDGAGRTLLSVGAPDRPCFPRSSNKPLQATAMVRCGLGVPDELLALASASHSGEDMHVTRVRALLASAGLDESDLKCPPSLPLDDKAARSVLAAGGEADRVHMNCSGKHAGMLATCAVNGWPTESYLEPDHPLQRAILSTIEELTGERIAHVGVDGCGAPLFALTLTGLARGFSALVRAGEGTAERRVADAFRAHPELTSGTERDEARLMRGVPGLLDKGGAEAVSAVALADGRALAVKIADGGARARTPVTVAALRALDIRAAVLEELATTQVTGGGRKVGQVSVVEGLFG